MTNKKSIWAFVLAFMLVVPAMLLFSACGRKHQHTFSAEWTRTETEHYHAATCEHGEEKADLGEHSGEWVPETAAGLHQDSIEKRVCVVCGYEQTRTVEGSAIHSFDMSAWMKDGEAHWHASSCDATDPAHAMIKGDYAKHSFGEWETKTEATYVKNKIEQRNCTICGYSEEREVENTKLPAKARQITVDDLTGRVFNGQNQPIDEQVHATNKEGGLKIEYRLKDDVVYSQTAPKDAGIYEYRITLSGTPEWQQVVKTGEFEIAKMTVQLSEVSFETNSDCIDELGLLLYGKADANGVNYYVYASTEYAVAGRHTIPTNKLFVQSEAGDNHQLNVGEIENIEVIVWDTADFYSEITSVMTVGGMPVIELTITQGTLNQGDELFVPELNKNITVQKIAQVTSSNELKKVTVGDNVYIAISGATKEELKTTFTLTAPNANVEMFEALVVTLQLYRKNEVGNDTGRHSPIMSGYAPTLKYTDSLKTAQCFVELPEAVEMIMPGEIVSDVVLWTTSKQAMIYGREFVLTEGGRTIARCTIQQGCERTAALEVERVEKDTSSTFGYYVYAKVKSGLIKKSDYIKLNESEKLYNVATLSKITTSGGVDTANAVEFAGPASKIKIWLVAQEKEGTVEEKLTGKTLYYQPVKTLNVGESAKINLELNESAYYLVAGNNSTGTSKLLHADCSDKIHLDVTFHAWDWSEVAYGNQKDKVQLSSGDYKFIVQVKRIKTLQGIASDPTLTLQLIDMA